MRKIAILGSTGSIGTQALEVVRANKDMKVTALAAGGSSIDLLEQQVQRVPAEDCMRMEPEDGGAVPHSHRRYETSGRV